MYVASRGNENERPGYIARPGPQLKKDSTTEATESFSSLFSVPSVANAFSSRAETNFGITSTDADPR